MGEKVKWTRQGSGYRSHDGKWFIGGYSVDGTVRWDLWREEKRIGGYLTHQDAARAAEGMHRDE